uniref:Protein kinase domain-containing protein n=1 Tax=Esox lucius TaxID=8010 RepID=A0A6Q2YU48_ESOLU
MVERYSLYHVKTLCYNDVQGVLEWLGGPGGNFTFTHTEDTVQVLNRFIGLHNLNKVVVMGIDEDPVVEGKDHIVVHTKRKSVPTIRNCTSDSIILFLVVKCNAIAPYTQELYTLIRDAHNIVKNTHTSLFPKFETCPVQQLEVATSQQAYPVIDGFLPSSYSTTEPRMPLVAVDSFGRRYEPLECTVSSDTNPWSLYAGISIPTDPTCDIDIEKLVTTPGKVLGRGGFGVAVPINKHQVVKTNLFPEMVNWSLPFIDREAVHVMERALVSLQEFMWRIDERRIVPMVELDTLRGLEHLRSKAIQHRDFTFRNVLVCHQPNRKPVPFTFKISDFGTACNFTTPDQPRGNHTNMAPEVLWCWTSSTGSDIFSWFCVMWELHSGFPLFPFKKGKLGYCRKTYAESLSNLLGVYSPENTDSFELEYMKAINARVLHAKYKDSRPTVHRIQANLDRMGAN